MSGKQAKRQRKQVPPPRVRSTAGRRRASPKVLGSVGAGIALVVAAIVIGVGVGGTSSSSSGSPTGTVATRGSLTNALPNAAAVAHEFAGIAQRGIVLGSAKAPVTMTEYIDLQCPFCREFETTVMPSIVRNFVRAGKLKVEARPIAFIGPDSTTGRLAALAAARQNRLFNFMQIVYANQGTENTGWLSQDFIDHAAASVPGMNVPRLRQQANSAAVKAEAGTLDTESSDDDVRVTPTLLVGKTGTRPQAVSAADEPTVAAAIEQALGS